MNLNDTIKAHLQALYDEMLEEGKLIPAAKLDNYCQTFRRKFGPKRLSNLDGEELLNTIHDISN